MTLSLDKLLAAHCAPVLMGQKPGALFSVAASPDAWRPYAELLAPEGIRFTTMGQKNGRSFIFVYRPALLAENLADPVAANILHQLGYPFNGKLEDMLEILKGRIAAAEDFPHEIGFFLGYPAEDVVGFIRNKGRDYKLCGTWKVYGDVERAQEIFARHAACREDMVQFVENGGSVCHYCKQAAAC